MDHISEWTISRDDLMDFGKEGKLMLRRRFVVETVFDKLKSEIGLVHTRHRSATNAFVHIMSCIAAYQGTSEQHCFVGLLF
jgi:hypothetical protein